jgi:hypothetical protein
VLYGRDEAQSVFLIKWGSSWFGWLTLDRLIPIIYNS